MIDLVVHTEHSQYRIDTAGKTFTRLPVAKEAANLRNDFTPVTYDSLSAPEIGEPMSVMIGGTVRRVTTPVTQIEHQERRN